MFKSLEYLYVIKNALHNSHFKSFECAFPYFVLVRFSLHLSLITSQQLITHSCFQFSSLLFSSNSRITPLAVMLVSWLSFFCSVSFSSIQLTSVQFNYHFLLRLVHLVVDQCIALFVSCLLLSLFTIIVQDKINHHHHQRNYTAHHPHVSVYLIFLKKF